jgi:hypothetical protein
MWPAIIGILRTVGTAATGYRLNDFGTWVANITGVGNKVVTPSGGFKWWYVLIIAIVLAGAVALVIWLLTSLVPIKRKRK